MPTRRKLTPDEAAAAASEETIAVSEPKEDLNKSEPESSSTVIDENESDVEDDELIGEYLFDDLEEMEIISEKSEQENSEPDEETEYFNDDEASEEESEAENETDEAAESGDEPYDESEIIPEEASPAVRSASSRTQRTPRTSKEISELGTYSSEYNKGLEQKYLAIRRMIRTKRILKVKIIKSHVISPEPNNPNATRRIFAGCVLSGYEEFTFLIPFDQLDCYKTESAEDGETFTIDQKIIYVKEMIHAKVNVIAEVSNLKRRIVICSRKEANYVLRRRYFYTGYTLPNSPHIRRTIGDNTIIRNANIIAVSFNNVLMETYGAQFKVPLYEISHHYLPNAYSLHPGDLVDVKLLNVTTEKDNLKYAKEYAPVKIVGSVKECKENIPLMALENAEPHESISGKITFISRNGDALGVTDSGYNFRVVYANARIHHLRVGSEVTVKLIQKVYNRRIPFGLVDLDDVVKL